MGKAVRVNEFDVSQGPILYKPYEILTDSFAGKPRGDVARLNPNDPVTKAALKEGALRLMPESSDNDDH